MNIVVIGTGYVGLVTGTALAEVGHLVTCVDLDAEKVARLRNGKSTIYEPRLEELIRHNILKGRLAFETELENAVKEDSVIFIAVGTPQSADGAANLDYILAAACDIAPFVREETIVVTKSTVPVGTNDLIADTIALACGTRPMMVSNPEFLREGSAVHDTFYGDRIVIGTEHEKAASVMRAIFEPFTVPIFETDIRSAEMIKYAANAFLATKISFINEMANVCEWKNADIEAVSIGIGMDKRIGSQFLQAGIGYGGSCFPKDTKALIAMARAEGKNLPLLDAVEAVNAVRYEKVLEQLLTIHHDLSGKKIAVLGLAFKPNTDDMRDAPSIKIIAKLLDAGARVVAYDPVATKEARPLLPGSVELHDEIEPALFDAEAAIIVTEWYEVKQLDLMALKTAMRVPVVIDGRNCMDQNQMKEAGIIYRSIGRNNHDRIPVLR
ncbi:UDP-glucose/GDP-mannose dehydrogenase family protein [Listeria booriae]|uniref:UDP-glucose dehydrogenase family protein n=1 Tax=Listeria booriae TaxID=1552123 RepID=UPI001628F419|nr:UDP-glucose/GDP-mannose dehydrogenase family protein [Listeria booriae]MBC1898932.1 UDP-glucose/GDP-mannose dehydrogenase family protein [Listeria booriae]